MKRKRLALLLAVAMTVTSLDSTAIVASGADFSSEVVESEEVSAQAEEESQPAVEDDATVETSDDDFSSDVEVTEPDAEVQTEPDETGADDAEVSTEEADFGDGENVSEIPAEAAGQAAPANATALEPGGTYTVSLDENNGAAWFSYTPTETGEYVIASYREDGSEIDPKVYLYQTNEDNELLSVSYDDDSNERDFRLRYTLNANTTYYYKATTYNGNDTSGEYQVDFQKVPSVESIAISMRDGADTTLIAGWDSYQKIENNIHMYITYEDGNTWENDVNGEVADNYGNTYSPVWENASGEAQDFNYEKCYLTEGTYSFHYKKSNGDLVDSNYVSVNAVSLENSEYYKGPLSEGENNNLSMSENDIFSFTPSTSGKWKLSFDEYPGISVRYKNESGIYSSVEETGGAAFVLTAGTTYYLQFKSAYDTHSVEIKLLPEIDAVAVDMTDSKISFYAGIERAFLAGCKLTVTYKNGETSSVVFESNSYDATDSQGTVFSYQFARKNEYGYFDWYSTGCQLPEDTYNLFFFADGEELNTGEYTVKAEDPASAGFRELKAGVNNEVNSPDDTYAWYSFTPEQTGKYFIGPCSSFEIYKDTEDNGISYVDHGWGNNGCICNLVEGVTYYIGLREKVWASDENGGSTPVNTFDLTITICDITKLAYSEKEITLLKGVNDLGKYAKLPAGKLTINHGESEETITPYLGGEVQDQYGNIIHSKITYKEDGEDKEYVFEQDEDDWNWKPLPVGTYTISFVYEDDSETESKVIESDPVTLTVRNPVAEDFRELQIGERNKDVEYFYYDEAIGDYVDSDWYLLRVEEAGTYKFQTYKGSSEYEGYTSAEWQKFDENGVSSAENDIKNESDSCVYLPAGNYLVKLHASDEYSRAIFDLDISRVKSVVSARIVSNTPEKPEYIARMEAAELDELTVEVTYDDQTTAEYSLNGNSTDSEGRQLNYSIYRKLDSDEGYREEYNNYLYADKTYFFRIFFGSTEVGDIPITVKSVKDYDSTDLNADGATDVKNQQKLLLKYTAKETGRYEFAFNIPVNKVLIKTEDDRPAEGIEKSDNNYFVNLEADTTYYLYVDANEDYEKLQVSVSMVTRPVKLSAKALKTEYLAGVEGFDDDSIDTTVDYSNQTSRTVRGNGYVSGYRVNYRLENENGERYWNGNTLTPGTWTVTPYLSAGTLSGSSVAVEMSEIPTETTTVTAGLTDLSKFTALKDSEWTDFQGTYGENVYYSFTPEQTGKYTWKTENVGIYGFNMEFYRQGENRYESLGSDIVDLNAGETYLVSVAASYDKKAMILPYAADPETETVSDLELKDGMEKPVVAGEQYSSRWSRYIKAAFTPDETAYYRLETSPWQDNWANTSIELYDEYGNQIASNGGYGQSENVALSYQLEKGKTYRYQIYVYTSNVSKLTTPFVLSFNKIQNKQIKSVEVVSTEGSDPNSLYVLRELEAFYSMKVTYEDGETKIYNLRDTKDAYGNRIFVDLKTVSEVQEDFECEVVLRYGQLDQGVSTYTEYKAQVPVRGLNVIEKLEEGKEYTSSEDAYRELIFTPSEDGEYIYTLKNQAEAYVYELGKYVNGSLMQMNADPSDEAEMRRQEATSRTIRLEKGRTYLFEVYAVNGSVSVKKAAKKLNGLTLVSAPEQATCLPGTINTISFNGLKVKASYTDGTTEDITYGTPDSCGRYIKVGGIQWLDGTRGRAYATLGDYRVSFEMKAGSWDSVEEIKNYETKTLKGARSGDVIAVKFAPETSGQYQISVIGGNTLPEITVSDSSELYRNSPMYLRKGKMYYFYICATSADPQVRIESGSCAWEELSRIEPTCSADGKITYRCEKHGDTKEEILPKLDHKWSEWKVTPATCTEDGVQTRTCSVGGETETKTIKATGHVWEEEQRVEPTETASGKIFHICKICKKEEVIKVLPATGVAARVDEVKNDLDKISDEVNSGTVTDDTKKKINSAVENITSIDNEELAKDANAMDTIKALEDTVLKANADKVAETVTSVEDETIGEVEVKGAALTAATVEAKEGQKLAAKVSVKAADAENTKKYEELPENAGKSVMALNITLAVVDKANNDVVVGEAAIQPKAPMQMTVNVPAQYQGRDLKLYHIKDGKQEALAYTLNEDGTKLTFVITALSDFTMVAGKCADDQHAYDEGKVTTAATCVNKGIKEYTCSKCGDVKKEDIPATGKHDYSVKSSEEPSTCSKHGYIIWKCATCDATKTEELELLEHQWAEPVVVKQATCTEEGTLRYQCKVCQTTKDETIAKVDHDYKWVTDKEATCEAAGSRHQECTACGEKGKTETIKATGKHSMGNWKVTKKATAVATGVQERTCKVCGGNKETKAIAKLKATVTLNVPKTLPMKTKQTFQVKATGLAAGDKVVEWTTSNKKIATVDKRTGKVKATSKTGKATITVKLLSGTKANFTVKVQKSDVATTSLTVVNKATGKKVAKTVNLKAKQKLTLVTTIAPVTSKQKVTYSTSNKKIATVSSKGVITAKKKGTVTITVKSGKKSVKIKVKVK